MLLVTLQLVLDTIIVALTFNIAFVDLVYSTRCCGDLFFFFPPLFPSRFFEFSPRDVVAISSFSFLHSFLLVFLNFPDLSLSFLCFWIFLICPFPRVFEFSWSVPSKNLLMGTWEHRNIAGSPPPPHNSLGIFCRGRSLKIQRQIKREVFMIYSLCASVELHYKCHED